MRIALITGASSGMGEVFARRIDQDEENIDEIWLIARRKNRLEEVAETLSHATRVIPMDLLSEENLRELERMLDEAEAQVGIFVACAGYGKIGNYEQISRLDSERMIDLNCKAAVDTTLIAIPRMRAGDRIVELCSTSSFLPLTHLNIYGAGKAFLLYYSRALRLELLPKGIIVTAVCPWWVGDTEFLGIARDNEANENTQQSVRHFIFPSKKENVVKMAMRASRRGRAVCTPGVICTVVRFFAKLVPQTTMQYLWELIRRA